MKILNLNTHSLIEDNYNEKCEIFAQKVFELKPDFITMQEVNQSIFSPWQKSLPENFTLCGNFPLRENNHALKVWKMLNNFGLEYNFCWCGFKIGYEKFEEGLAIFSRFPIDNVSSFYITKSYDHLNWRTRKTLIINSGNFSIATTHTGWWEDKTEPLKYQLDRLFEGLREYKNLILTGDFNSPDTEDNKGYSYILSNGFFDTFTLAKNKDSGKTVMGKIDGWENHQDKRIDYVFLNENKNVKSSYTLFDGPDKVSDHKGIIVTI